MVLKPGDVLLSDDLHLARFAVQPGADRDPRHDAGRPEGSVIAQLRGQEQVPPSSHHAGRRKPGQVGAVMIRARPELVGRRGMLDEVPPEGDRRTRNVDIGGLQRNLAQGPFRPGQLPRVRDNG